MSILHSLLKWVDIIEYRMKQAGDRTTRKKRAPGLPDDEDVELPEERPASAEAPLVCRICGYSGGPEHRFCPRCLAETMERRR